MRLTIRVHLAFNGCNNFQLKNSRAPDRRMVVYPICSLTDNWRYMDTKRLYPYFSCFKLGFTLGFTLGNKHARQKRRCVNDPCLFQLYLLWKSNCIYAACLSIEMEVKRNNQSKAPSINNKHCFLFPLSFFVTAAVFTRVPFFDRNAKGP